MKEDRVNKAFINIWSPPLYKFGQWYNFETHNISGFEMFI